MRKRKAREQWTSAKCLSDKARKCIQSSLARTSHRQVCLAYTSIAGMQPGYEKTARILNFLVFFFYVDLRKNAQVFPLVLLLLRLLLCCENGSKCVLATDNLSNERERASRRKEEKKREKKMLDRECLQRTFLLQMMHSQTKTESPNVNRCSHPSLPICVDGVWTKKCPCASVSKHVAFSDSFLAVIERLLTTDCNSTCRWSIVQLHWFYFFSSTLSVLLAMVFSYVSSNTVCRFDETRMFSESI